eukprot:3296961-Alexandrium_andersonii.AAC.1
MFLPEAIVCLSRGTLGAARMSESGVKSLGSWIHLRELIGVLGADIANARGREGVQGARSAT